MPLISKQSMRNSAVELMAKYGPLSWANKCLLSVLRTVHEKSLSSNVFRYRLNFTMSDPVGFSWDCWHE